MLLKGILARRSWPIDAVVGADCRGRGSDSLGRRRISRIGSEFPLNFASKEATIALDRGPRSSGDQATIAWRSGLDDGLFSCRLQLKPCVLYRGIDSTMKEPRSRLDRTAIVVRSHHDHGFLPRIFFAVRWSFR